VRIASTLAGALSVLAAGLSGCGSDAAPQTPVACLGPPSAYLTALEAAPGEVLLAGTTPIGACLVDEQPAGSLQTVGQALIAAATDLNAEIRRDRDPETIVRLGYLVGAVQDAAGGTGGIHEDLVLRLDTAARFTGEQGRPFSAGFERAFGEGYAAGQAAG
jgi:hypothetical protein